MRVLLAVILLFALVLSGCARNKAGRQPTDSAAGAAASKAAVAGQVARVNPVGRFVVLSFPPDQMPVLDQPLGVYRRGSKVAELKVTGPQRGNSIVADILSGAPEAGDQARAD